MKESPPPDNLPIVTEYPKRPVGHAAILLGLIIMAAGMWTLMIFVFLSFFGVKCDFSSDGFLGTWIALILAGWIFREKVLPSGRQFKVGDAVTYNDHWLSSNMGLDERYIREKTSLVDFGIGEVKGFKIAGDDIRVVVKWVGGKWEMAEPKTAVLAAVYLRKLK